MKAFRPVAFRFAASVSLFVLGSTTGCAVDASDSESAASDAESADEALTGAKVYDCRGGERGADVLTHLELAVTASKAAVTDVSRSAVRPDTGVIDPSYRPTSTTYAGSTRFVGFGKIADDLSDDVSNVEIMVSGDLMKKGPKGRMWLRTSGPEGAGTDSFFCTAKAGALAVKVAKKSRLLCDLDKLSCEPGNPPGDTCLSELFVNQTDDDSSTLRLTYLDHFGVNVSERKEPIGASTKFSRTKKSVSAKWAGYALDLTYRAGVTYKGKLTLPNGKVSPVSCSDLAMFD